MALFQYQVFDKLHAELSGTLLADSPRHARDQLRERGYLIAEVKEVKEKRNKSKTSRPLGRASARVLMFTRELSTLLRVGISLIDALDTLSRGQKGRFRQVILRIRDRCASGLSLADALRAEPGDFDEMVVNITQVGEASGTLDEVLRRWAEFKERGEKLRGQISGALIYPAIVLSMACVVTTLLMTFVVPGILQPLLESGAELPWVTRVVKSLSDALLAYWWALALGVIFAMVSARLILRSERGRFHFHRLILRLPVLGDMIRKQAITQICVVTSTLLKSGVVFLEALEIAQRSTRNLVMRRALEVCREGVTSGRDISKALESTGAFPPTVVEIFSLGQKTGQLEEMLEKLAEDYDHQVYALSQRFTALMEPALILLLAVLVGFIAFATVLPILEAGHVL